MFGASVEKRVGYLRLSYKDEIKKKNSKLKGGEPIWSKLSNPDNNING